MIIRLTSGTILLGNFNTLDLPSTLKFCRALPEMKQGCLRQGEDLELIISFEIKDLGYKRSITDMRHGIECHAHNDMSSWTNEKMNCRNEVYSYKCGHTL